MIICFDCDRDTKKLLDDLLSEGDYSDYGEAISVAIKNLKMIQRAIGVNGSLVLNSEDKSLPKKTAKEKAKPLEKVVERKLSEGIAKSYESAVSSVPKLFARPAEDFEGPDLMPLPDDVWVKGTEVPVHRWLFAMYNKLLPAKANCRALCNLAKNSGNGVELGLATESISQAALQLGNYLLDWDAKLGLNRDSSLATAFPTSSKDADKSISRYGNQFVANLNKYGKLTGLLFALKLINYKQSKKTTFLHLTEPGWRFARIENPIFDSDDVTGDKRFSDNEIDFLLEHIAASVPAEFSAYQAILSLVQAGSNTPDSIDSELQASVPDKDKDRVSVSYLVSQRSGSVSRMSDLNLIRRVRNGVSFTYEATERGAAFCNKHSLTE